MLDTVLIPFDTVCIFDTDTDADVEGELLLEEEVVSVIEFTDDVEPLLTTESVPAAPPPTPTAVCELLTDIEIVDVTEFVWLTDPDSDVEIVGLELTMTLAVMAELRERNTVDDKKLVGLLTMLAEEVKLALAVAAAVRLSIPVKVPSKDELGDSDDVNDGNKLDVGTTVKVTLPVGDRVEEAEYVDEMVFFAVGLLVAVLLRLFSAELDALGLELDEPEGEGLTEGECVADGDVEIEEVAVTVDEKDLPIEAVFFADAVPVMVGDAERERVGDVVAELESDQRPEPDEVTVVLGDPVCDSVTDPELDICAEDEEDKEPEVVAEFERVSVGEVESDGILVPEPEFVGERVKRGVADIELVALNVRVRVAFELVDGVLVETVDSLLGGEGVTDNDCVTEVVAEKVCVTEEDIDDEELPLPVLDAVSAHTETAAASRRKHSGDSPKRKRVGTKLLPTLLRICALCYVRVAGVKDERCALFCKI